MIQKQCCSLGPLVGVSDTSSNGLLPVCNRLILVGEGVFQINWDYFLKLEKFALQM